MDYIDDLERDKRIKVDEVINLIDSELIEKGYDTKLNSESFYTANLNLETINYDPEFILMTSYGVESSKNSFLNKFIYFFNRYFIMNLIIAICLVLLIFFSINIIVENSIAGLLIDIAILFVIWIPFNYRLNKNHSGIETLIEIMDHITEKDKLKLVFLKNGITSSTLQKRYWKKDNFDLENKKIINIRTRNKKKPPVIYYSKKTNFLNKISYIFSKEFENFDVVKKDLEHYPFKNAEAISIDIGNNKDNIIKIKKILEEIIDKKRH